MKRRVELEIKRNKFYKSYEENDIIRETILAPFCSD